MCNEMKIVSLLFSSEYARYLHSKLDLPVEKLDLEEDFSQQYRHYWAKSLPFMHKVCTTNIKTF